MEIQLLRRELESHGLTRVKGNRYQLRAVLRQCLLLELIPQVLSQLENYLSMVQLLRLSATCKTLRKALSELSVMHMRMNNPITVWYQINHRDTLHLISPTGQSFKFVLTESEYLLGRSRKDNLFPQLPLVELYISKLHFVITKCVRGYGLTVKGRHGAIWNDTGISLEKDRLYNTGGHWIRFPSNHRSWRLRFC